jgi:hypothetical protein
VVAGAAVLLAIGGVLLIPMWGLGVPLIIIGAFAPVPGILWRRRAAVDDEKGDARERLLEECLRPLLQLAASTTSHARVERVRTMESAAVQASRDLRNAFADIAGVRVVVFKISDDGTQMVPYPPAGRQSRPGPFVRGTGRGDKAFAVLEGPDPFVIVEDLTKAQPSEWQGTGDGYRTFISAPIRTIDDGLGLLTLDAPTPGVLDARHGSTLALFAAALGVLFAEAMRGGGGPS